MDLPRIDMIKCKICDQRLSKVDIKDHLKMCIYNVGYGDPSRLYFIKEYLGDKELIIYINGLPEQTLGEFFSPIDFKVTPVVYPIYYILDSVSNGLKSNDPEFYNNTIQLLRSFFRDLTRLFKRHNRISIDYYLPSLLEVFNEVYGLNLENKLDDGDLPNLKESFERLVKKNKEIVKYCYYELGGTDHWGSKIYFLNDTDFFSQEFYKLLKTYGLEVHETLAKSSLDGDLIRKIIINNLQNGEITDIFPRVRNLLEYEGSFFDDFKIKLGDFLEYIINSKEANSIRQIPIYFLDIEIDDKTGRHKGNLIFNKHKHVIYYQRNGRWGLGLDVLEVFPESLFDLTHLQKLDLSRNKITNIPSSIDTLSELETLELTKNEITILPESIGNLENLKVLYIDENKIRSLPTSIEKLKSLETLSLDNNKLRNLPTSIEKLKSLETLSLSKNKLKSLPKSMSKLPNLKFLYINNNYFRKIPEVLTNIQSLVEIGISNNDIQTIPESILNLKSLDRLFVKNTRIKARPEFLKDNKSLRIVI